jgi:hypothetical protein
LVELLVVVQAVGGSSPLAHPQKNPATAGFCCPGRGVPVQTCRGVNESVNMPRGRGRDRREATQKASARVGSNGSAGPRDAWRVLTCPFDPICSVCHWRPQRRRPNDRSRRSGALLAPRPWRLCRVSPFWLTRRRHPGLLCRRRQQQPSRLAPLHACPQPPDRVAPPPPPRAPHDPAAARPNPDTNASSRSSATNPLWEQRRSG